MSWLIYVIMTILCWGAYVVTIHVGQMKIGGASKGLWAFLFVGLAYFLVAVLVPIGILIARGELTTLPKNGVTISTFAGILGAVGALGVILAFMTGGRPIVVAPLVFAGAPIVNTIIAMLVHKPEKAPHPAFFAGILLAALGAALVLRFKPA